MTDNGVTLANCIGPAPTNQGSLAYSCDETYANSDAGTHLIVGAFLGDGTYGQSAGQLDETVQPSTGTTTTTESPTPYFRVTSIQFQNPETFDVSLDFQNISILTVTDNEGDICTFGAESFSGGATGVACGVPNLIETLTSLTVSSPGLPSETFTWPRLYPTVTAVSGGTNLTTFTLSGTFTPNEPASSGFIGGVRIEVGDSGDVAWCSMDFTATSVVSCQANVSLATAESNTINVRWYSCNYTFDSAQGTPMSVPDSGGSDKYDASTNSWY
jgi:hypothetical protein